MNNDYKCICGHLESQHVCSAKTHKLKGKEHICNITDRVFCCNTDIIDPPWSCKCEKVVLDNLSYLQMRYDERTL